MKTILMPLNIEGKGQSLAMHWRRHPSDSNIVALLAAAVRNDVQHEIGLIRISYSTLVQDRPKLIPEVYHLALRAGLLVKSL